MEIETHCATRGIPSVNGAKTQQTQVLVDALHGILERTAQGEVVRGELLRNVQDTARKPWKILGVIFCFLQENCSFLQEKIGCSPPPP